MTPEDREDIRYIVEEEMRRVTSTSARVNACCSRLEELVEQIIQRRQNPTVADRMCEDYRRLIAQAA